MKPNKPMKCVCAGGEPPRGANLKEWIHLQNAGPGTNISPRLTHLWSVLELRAEGLFISLRSGITRARLPAQAHLQLPAPGHPHRPAGAQWRSRGDPAAPSEAGRPATLHKPERERPRRSEREEGARVTRKRLEQGFRAPAGRPPLGLSFPHDPQGFGVHRRSQTSRST